MEEKEKLYDAILTEGARWMSYQRKLYIDTADGIGIRHVYLNKAYYGFLKMAEIFATYGESFYVGGNFFRYLYLKYIKKFRFLKWAWRKDVVYLDYAVFLYELTNHFNKPFSIVQDIYSYYYEEKN